MLYSHINSLFFTNLTYCIQASYLCIFYAVPCPGKVWRYVHPFFRTFHNMPNAFFYFALFIFIKHYSVLLHALSLLLFIIFTRSYVILYCNMLLCYVMLCYVMSCYVMLCYAMLCYVMLCYDIICYVILWYNMLCYIVFLYISSYLIGYHKITTLTIIMIIINN